MTLYFILGFLIAFALGCIVGRKTAYRAYRKAFKDELREQGELGLPYPEVLMDPPLPKLTDGFAHIFAKKG